MKDNNYIHQTIPGFVGLALYTGAFWWPQWLWIEVVCWTVMGLGVVGLFMRQAMLNVKEFYTCNWFYAITCLQIAGALAIFYFNQPQSYYFGAAYLIYLILSFTRMLTCK